MVQYEEYVYISTSEYDRVNRLLAIESLEEITDEELVEQEANTGCCEELFYVEFENGAVMTIDLCSGTHNYYDNVVWTSADGRRNIVLDCEYKLDDIEVEIESELYVIKIVKE